MLGTKANFHFYGPLNDFLPFAQRAAPFEYAFKGKPAIKDAIEAVGVPHPEVDVILVNKAPVNFRYQLQPADEVEIYPASSAFLWEEGYTLTLPWLLPVRFILDVHLGKLAKNLRMLGFDTLYENSYSDPEIIDLAEKDGRIILTRDIGLLKNSKVTWGYWLRSQFTQEQLAEVVSRYKLQNSIKSFTRCLECNGLIEPVEKAEVLEQLPPRTRAYFTEFYQCVSCRKVYWKGSHFERMEIFIRKIQEGGN